MTPQPHPYRSHHQQSPSPPHAPASSPSNSYPPVTGGGDGAAHQVGRAPNVATRFPASTTAVSQADGEA